MTPQTQSLVNRLRRATCAKTGLEPETKAVAAEVLRWARDQHLRANRNSQPWWDGWASTRRVLLDAQREMSAPQKKLARRVKQE